MARFIMLTRILPGASARKISLAAVADQVRHIIESDRDRSSIVDSYVVLGPWDLVNIFEAPDHETASRVETTVNSLGCMVSELLLATSWERFRFLASELDRPSPRGRGGIDPVEEASKESFPASDAPAWTGAIVR